MTSERSKRRDFLSLIFISKSISKKLLIKMIIIIIIIISINIIIIIIIIKARKTYVCSLKTIVSLLPLRLIRNGTFEFVGKRILLYYCFSKSAVFSLF